MTPGDRAACLAMAEQFYSSPAVEHAVDPSVLARAFDAAAGPNPRVDGFVLEEDGRAAGYAYLTYFYSCEVGGDVVMIEELYLKEPFRGRGLGSQFFRWLLARFPGAARFRLEVTAENTGAARLYRRWGFRPLGYGQMVLDRDV